MNHIERIVFIFPTLIGIDSYRERTDRTNCLNHLLIIFTSQFYLQNIKLSGHLKCLFTYYIRCINTNSKRSRRCLFFIQSPYLIPGSSQQLSYQIMQSNIYRRFCCRIARTQTINISQNIFQLKRIIKLFQINLTQKRHHTIHCLPQIGRHGGFTISGHPFIFYFHLHIRSRSTRKGSYRKHMLQF